MSGWLDLSGSTSSSNSSSNTNSSFNGTSATANNPTLSDYWKNAFGNSSSNLGLGGFNPTQLAGVNYMGGYINPNTNPIDLTTAYGNRAISGLSDNTGGDNTGGLAGVQNLYGGKANGSDFTLASLAASGNPAYQAPSSVSANGIQAPSAASQMAPYSALYSSAMIDPSLSAYDYGTGRAFSALDARTAGAGGFANDRSGLAYSDLGAQSALGRGQLYSQLANLGLTNAANLGAGDASRITNANVQNAQNQLGAQEFNANLTNQRQQFDILSAMQQENQRLQAIAGLSSTIQARAGLSQGQVDNVMKNGSIDLGAANQMLNAGTISQDQFNQLVTLAGAANGSTSSTTASGSGQSNTNQSGSSSKFGFGLSLPAPGS